MNSSEKKENTVLIVLLSLSMSLISFGIDSVLPGFRSISEEFRLQNPNSIQFIVSIFFLGMTFGQLIYGPYSDSFGRKNAMLFGLGLFFIGSIGVYFSSQFETMLFWRFIQGLGAGAPRVVSFATIRDKFSKKEMSQAISFLMMIFVLTPAIAPTIGSFVLWFFSWRVVFLLMAAAAFINFVLLFTKLKETLPSENRRPMNLRTLFLSFKEVLTTRKVLIYTLISSFLFAVFILYINTVEQIFVEIYHQKDLFPLIFASGALSFFLANFVNTRLMKLEKLRVSSLVFWIVFVNAFVFADLSFWVYVHDGIPPLLIFMVHLWVFMFLMGIAVPCVNTLALESLGHIAGTVSTVVAFISSLLSLGIGAYIGSLLTDNVYAFALGGEVCAFLALISLFALPKKEKNKFKNCLKS